MLRLLPIPELLVVLAIAAIIFGPRTLLGLGRWNR
jgi:Sec-independent protein translocase protein TatA